MASPRVSVIMSVYNGLPFLVQSIRSILTQTFTEFEFIVVDDGSTDGTWEVLAVHASRDPRMVLLRNEENLGLTRSLNRGIQSSQGMYLARQDSDDVSLPDRLAQQVDYLDMHPQIGVVGVFPQFIDAQNRQLANSKYPKLHDNDSLQRQLLVSNCLVAGSVMIRRKWLDIVDGYDPDIKYSQDYDLWLRLAEVTELANIPQALYQYRMHSTSITDDKVHLQLFFKATALERALIRRYDGEPPKDLMEQATRDYLRAACLALAKGEELSARSSYKHAEDSLPGIDRTGDLIENVAIEHISNFPAADPHVFVESLFDKLFPSTPHLLRVKSRLLSKLHMEYVFKAEAEGRDSQFSRHWWQGVRANPRWLFNRGVLAIGIKHLLELGTGIFKSTNHRD